MKTFLSLTALGCALLCFAGCKDFSMPSEDQTTIIFERDIVMDFDMQQWTTLDHIDASSESIDFLNIQDRITAIGILSPLVKISSYVGPDSAMIDTLLVKVGPETGAIDTLVPASTSWRPAVDTAMPAQMTFVQITASERVANLLTHAPHRLALSTHIHTTKPVSHLKIHVVYPILVNYLN